MTFKAQIESETKPNLQQNNIRGNFRVAVDFDDLTHSQGATLYLFELAALSYS